LNYKVTNIQIGKYESDTLFIEVDKEVFQIPISKKAKVTKDLIGKLINIENLYNVPLEKVILSNISFDKQ